MENLITKEILSVYDNDNSLNAKSLINKICKNKELVSMMVGYFIALGDLPMNLKEDE
jgi:hypothetical protein